MLDLLLTLVFIVIFTYIGYKIIEKHGFKGLFLYNLIISIIPTVFEIYSYLNITIILVSLLIIVVSSLVNSYIQVWAYKITSGFIGYLLLTALVSGIFSALLEVFINPIFEKIIVWLLNLFGIIG